MSNLIAGNISSAELAEDADANFVVHASWALKCTAGMRVSDELGIVLTDSGLPCDTFNIACRARLVAGQAPQQIQAALAFFRQVGRPFSWWVGPGDQQFARTIADPEGFRFYERTASALLAPDSPQWFYVGYLDGQPVATAELAVGGGVVGLYNISTLEAYRRQGIGTAMTLQPLLDARASGFRTGILQAAAAGVSIYARLGFKPFGDITEYKPPYHLTLTYRIPRPSG